MSCSVLGSPKELEHIHTQRTQVTQVVTGHIGLLPSFHDHIFYIVIYILLLYFLYYKTLFFKGLKNPVEICSVLQTFTTIINNCDEIDLF